MVRVFSVRIRVTFGRCRRSDTCIPIDAKYKKTETIGFTTRFRPKDKKALKKVVKLAKWQVQSKMFICKT
jgi:hypothetical protein